MEHIVYVRVLNVKTTYFIPRIYYHTPVLLPKTETRVRLVDPFNRSLTLNHPAPSHPVRSISSTQKYTHFFLTFLSSSGLIISFVSVTTKI